MTLAQVRAQDPAIAVLRHALQHGRLAHAYLFVGPSGTGKRLAARALVQARLCPEQPGEGCGRCSICQRLSDMNHPDLRVFEPRDEGNRNIKIDTIRDEVLPFTKFAPFEGDAAFVIFPEADISFPRQHSESANALLKTLEEPRAAVHFILLSDRPNRLLTTIRSRCQQLRFGALPTPVVREILAARGIDDEVARPAAALSAGRADRAIALCEEDRAARLFEWTLRADDAIAATDAGPLLDLGEELARDDDRDYLLESLAQFYRDLAAVGLGADDGQLAFAHRSEELRRRAGRVAPAAAAGRVLAIQELGDALARNANPEIAFDGLLLGLSRPL
ncbi:MAG: DNA polymerase III subunit [Myxococcales bacterium]|nr:DNA polymerase III subunit [Myxococcales bacterium]